jgi:hypothetical protein
MKIIMSKKVLIVFLLFLSLICKINADELADRLQDLAIQTACLGMYSSTEAGIRDNITNRYIDPPDWYIPPMMAQRFSNMSGSMTRTITFYGICFDYAQFAWDDIKKYKNVYNEAGMKDSEWYIAVTYPNDPNIIYLYDPVSADRATTILNGIPVRENSRHRVRSHDNATGHAWIWVQHKNGTWYWIDPTWTDNTGYPWWGIVKDGKEVQYYPNRNYSIATNYPRPPSPNETQTERETRSPNSTYVSYSGNPTYYTNSYDPSQSHYLLLGYNFAYGKPLGFTIADSMFFEKSLIYISANFGFSIDPGRLEIEWIYGVAISITDWLRIPIGIGGNHFGKDGEVPTGGYTSINGNVTYDTKNKPLADWEHAFVIEAGIQPVIKDIFYLSATYRLIGFSRSGFSIGAGFVF